MRTFCFRIATLRKQLDHAGHRVRPEQRRIRTAHHLNPFDASRAEIAEIKAAARKVQRNTVQQYLVVIAVPAADKDACNSAWSSVPHNLNTWKRLQKVAYQGSVLLNDLAARNHADICSQLA